MASVTKNYSDVKRQGTKHAGGTDGAALDAFYTPQNADFYSRGLYTPLEPPKNQIRLLQIFPESEDGILRCELRPPCSLGDTTQPFVRYSALSYAAGDPNKTTTILVNGVPFNAFANLARALEEARSYLLEYDRDLSEDYIWADQICINQSDPQERSQQVAFMDRIYSTCDAVLVCLPAANQTCRGIELACFLGSEALNCHLHGSKEVARHHPWLSKMAQRGLEDYIDTWKSMLDLFQSDWWSRAWICQEFILAPRGFFMGGGHAIPWQLLFSVIESLFVPKQTENAVYYLVKDLRPQSARRTREFLDLVRSKLRQLTTEHYRLVGNEKYRLVLDALTQGLDPSPLIPRYLAGNRSSEQILQLMGMKAGKQIFTLPELLYYGRQCRTSDPRDKVFAFLGLADFRHTIQPDYTSTQNEVLVDVAARMFERSPSTVLLNALSNKRPSTSRLDGLPSWVPTWLEEREEREHSAEPLVPYTVKGPTPESRFTYKRTDFHGQRYHVLRLWGFRIGTVNDDGTLNSLFSKNQPIQPRNLGVREKDELWTIWIAPDVAQDFIVRRSDRYYRLISDVFWRPPGSLLGDVNSGVVEIRQIGTGPTNKYVYTHRHPRFSLSMKTRACECLQMEAIELA
ncbi:hypothetical protein GQ53DRAFT_348130 [Thozetella sp. PMI_491]|nr:hypothetical protein GQ53DRAFT_348130 [Thozetella sp. PMI_491]